jgi:putative Holliday junction resolvase
MLAQALKLYTRGTVQNDLEELGRLVHAHDVKEIVVGLPKDLSGAMGKRAQSVAAFAKQIERHTGLRVVLWDERFSTNEANRIFEMAQVNHKKRKPFIDMMASQIILQGYLDAPKTE